MIRGIVLSTTVILWDGLGDEIDKDMTLRLILIHDDEVYSKASTNTCIQLFLMSFLWDRRWPRQGHISHLMFDYDDHSSF